MAFENRLPGNISLLPATYFFLGLFSLVSQTMIIREFLLVVYGNEIILGILFFNWLVGIFAGSISGATNADRFKNPLLLFVIAILIMCLLMPIAITCTRFLYKISSTAVGAYIGFFKVFLFSGIFIISLVFFIGFSFLLAARIQLTGQNGRIEKVQKISSIYILEAAGFLSGGMLYTFILAGRFNPYFIAGLIMLLLLFASAFLLRRFRFFKTLTPVFTAILLSAALLLPPVNGKIEEITIKKRWESVSPTPLLYSVNSKYQNIAVAGYFNQYNLYLNNMYSSTFPESEENMILAAHLYCQHPGPKRVLIIGDALTGLAGYLLAYDIDKILSVEIDPLAVETITKFLPEESKQVLGEQRFRIEISDGRKFVTEQIGKSPRFDIVYLNVPEPATLLVNRYYTRDFFLDLSKIVAEDGYIAFKVTSSENYGKGLVSDYTASLYHTAASVFPEIVVAPGTYNIIFACRGKKILSDNPETLTRRYAKSGVKPEKLGAIFHSLYPADRTDYIKNILKNSPKHLINRDEHPVAHFYFSKIIGWYAGSNVERVLLFFEGIELPILIFFILLLFFLRLVYVFWKMKKSRHPDYGNRSLKFHALLTVFCCGMAGISLELVIIYTFQNIFGYMYHIIGFIIALFMCGLPAGASFSNLLIARKKSHGSAYIIKLMILLQMILSLLSLFISRMGKLFSGITLSNQVMIFFITILLGFTVGMVFPLALHIYLNREERIGKAAGIVNAYDHLGAAAGALLMGTLFLPILGVFKTCLLINLFLLGSALLIALHVRFLFARQKNFQN
ncbi:hypothetical protein ACFLRB_01985 [Acidobacteriota bacterium]